jgi:F-type H+-transporting ATPase subunit delta
MTARTSALRYARALLDVALAEADPVAVGRELAASADTFKGHDALWMVLTNPAVPAPKKRTIIDELLPRLEVCSVVAKTLQMLASRDRMGLLPDIVDAYRDRLLDHQNVVRASVTSAVPLPADRVAALQQELAGVTGRSVVMTATTDPSIVGGVVAQIGSMVYDGSVRRQLEKLRERLAGGGQ